jgi:hypothetical protein
MHLVRHDRECRLTAKRDIAIIRPLRRRLEFLRLQIIPHAVAECREVHRSLTAFVAPGRVALECLAGLQIVPDARVSPFLVPLPDGDRLSRTCPPWRCGTDARRRRARCGGPSVEALRRSAARRIR